MTSTSWDTTILSRALTLRRDTRRRLERLVPAGKDDSKRRQKTPRQGFQAICTVPGCNWVGEAEGTERRAKRTVGSHAAERHSQIKNVLVRRVVRTEIVDS